MHAHCADGFNFFEYGVGQKFLCGFPNNTVCLKLVGVFKEAGRNFIIFYVHVNRQPKNVKKPIANLQKVLVYY
jgi:hypothetical protein